MRSFAEPKAPDPARPARRSPWSEGRSRWDFTPPWAAFVSAGFGARDARGPGAVAPRVQAKLKVSRPGDAAEREADRVADGLMRGEAAPAVGGAAPGAVQRKCSACGETDGSMGTRGKCPSCDEETDAKHPTVQRKPAAASGAAASGPPAASVSSAVRGAGQPLAPPTRAFFEQGLGHDLGGVRVHVGGAAAESARALDARAYTFGSDIVFGAGEYAPETSEGGRLLAHELVHVVQQSGGAEAGGVIQRACLSGPTCAAPAGSSSVFGTAVDTREAAARARRGAMPPARQRATGHAGPARQLERLLDAEAPGLRANVHGIFIDQDMDPDVAASTQSCASMVPPITGATKPCVFVPPQLNQQALLFNTNPAAATIGGKPRETWRIETIQTLVHEVQHVLYDTSVSGRPLPAGVTTCTRADVDHELSELNAIMSEFPSVFSAVPAGAPPGDPAVTRLADWFNHSITNTGESIRGILTTIRCKCSCPDTDTFIRETFAFVTAAWPAAQKAAFNAELRKPVWALSWPL